MQRTIFARPNARERAIIFADRCYGDYEEALKSMARAIFVRVSAEPAATQARTFEIWIVATDDPAAAEKAVMEMVPLGRNVEAIHDRQSEETIKRLALTPGKAWLL